MICPVFRLGVGLLVDRGAVVFTVCGRSGFSCGAGWSVSGRADFIRPLSCLTEALNASPAATFDRSGKTNRSH
jgi:hypothetical protein